MAITLTTPVSRLVGVVSHEPVNLGNIVTTVTFDASAGNVFKATATGAVTVGAPTGMREGQHITVIITAGAGGSHAVTWDAAWDWGSGTAPDTSATAAGTWICVSGYSDGTTISMGGKDGFGA